MKHPVPRSRRKKPDMQTETQVNRGGRPTLHPDQRMVGITLRVTQEMLDHLDARVAARHGAVDRSTVIRELIVADMTKGKR